MPQAGRELSETDKDWFVDTLQNEFAQLGNLPKFEGTAIFADRVIVNILNQPATPDPTETLSSYWQDLFEKYQRVSLWGRDVDASDPTQDQKRPELAQVYIDLHTTTQVAVATGKKRGPKERDVFDERESRPLSVLDAVLTHRHVVLLGDPGSGKSTFLNHLALCLAGHGLNSQAGWLTRLPQWPEQEAGLVPISVILRDFARQLPKTGPKKANARLLWEFIASSLADDDLPAEPLHDLLKNGQAVLLLDGLDEIPEPSHRVFMRDLVAACAKRYRKCRIIVTCRTLSYQEADWQLKDFPTFTLAQFNTDQINHFIEAWYAELSRLGTLKSEKAERLTQRLQREVRRPDIWRLAPTPLLLTVMTLLHAHKELPNSRAQLYQETVDMLLHLWEQHKAKESGADDESQLSDLLAQAGRTTMDLKRVLGKLAFTVHSASGSADTEALADIGQLQLQNELIRLHPEESPNWALQVIDTMKLRAGLLLERESQVYTFPHRTFQEYLAGSHLPTHSSFAKEASRLASEGALWREVILLAVGHLVYVKEDPEKPLPMIAELCPKQAKNTATAWQKAWLAGDALLEMGPNRADDTELGRELNERVRQRLVSLIQGSRLSPVERVRAGDTLARLGDPRFRADAWFLPDDDLLGFVEIPQGPFLMGSTEEEDNAYDDEKPQHLLSLPDYYIARYPVTVAQFRAFVEEENYTWEGKDEPQGQTNHPVV